MARQPIRQLSPALVNRIAAGEVIERPASVVKELVENALDAGASRIAVEIEDGGRALIRVIDDGGGIPPAELPLAFAAHATSKLQTDDDLFRIVTLGFRGEALASIGAVSQSRIVTRRPDDAVAHCIEDRGGDVGPAHEAAGNAGTVIEVRNLFFNTPARRRFLKGAGTEFGHITEALLRLALPNPHIHFTLMHDGRATMDLPATMPDKRWLAAWPTEMADGAMTIDAAGPLGLIGLIAQPQWARPTARYQYFYLNGRPIRDRFVQHAVRESYRGLTEPGRHPAVVLLLTIPPGDVDVNVHPTKSEVRFRDSGQIHGLVLATLREKLLGSDLTPAAVPGASTWSTFRPPAETPGTDMRSRLAEFFRSALPSTPGSPEAFASVSEPTALPSPNVVPPAPPIYSTVLPMPELGGSMAIQLHNSYLVVESDDGLLIIDQHALHERILYEELLVRLNRGPLESQRLLVPLTFPATPRQQALLEQIQSLLARLGIEAAPIGPTGVAVHAFPTFLQRLDPVEFVAELLERGEQESFNPTQEEVMHEVLDMMACKSAVKAGDPLTAAEIAALLARRDLVDRSSNCPHGRPTTLRLTLRDLEKQFKRTGF